MCLLSKPLELSVEMMLVTTLLPLYSPTWSFFLTKYTGFYVKLVVSIGKTKGVPVYVTDWACLWVMLVRLLPGLEELTWRDPMSWAATEAFGLLEEVMGPRSYSSSSS